MLKILHHQKEDTDNHNQPSQNLEKQCWSLGRQ